MFQSRCSKAADLNELQRQRARLFSVLILALYHRSENIQIVAPSRNGMVFTLALRALANLCKYALFVHSETLNHLSEKHKALKSAKNYTDIHLNFPPTP